MQDMQLQPGYFPYDEIPDTGLVPVGTYQVTGVSLEETQSSTGKKMFSMQIQVEQPDDFMGNMLFENFVIGSDADPQGQLLSTYKRSFGARRMKAMLRAAQIPATNSEAQVCTGFTGTVFLVSVTIQKDKEGDYAGMERNRISGFHKIGERAIGLAPGVGVGKPVGLATVPMAPTAPLPAAPVAPAPVAPVAAPAPLPPQPVTAPVAPVITPAPASVVGGQVVPSLPCGRCNKMVLVTEWAGHAAECMKGAA